MPRQFGAGERIVCARDLVERTGYRLPPSCTRSTLAMAARIIDRGRGPEVAGRRVTVYRIMDFVREGSSAADIAAELHLTEEQVRVALDYIAVHRRIVEAEYT